MGSFATSDGQKSRDHQPIRVPIQRGSVFQSAREMAEDLSGWTVESADEAAGRIVCRKQNGFLGGTSTITITVEGPDGIPSSTVHVASQSGAALLSRDKANVAEFVRPFFRRIC